MSNNQRISLAGSIPKGSLLSGFDHPDWFAEVHGVDEGYDEEFNAVGSSLPDGWEWFNQDGALYAEVFGYGRVDWGGGGDTSNWHGVVMDLPDSGAFEIYSHMWGLTEGTANYYGLVLRDSAAGKLVTPEVWVNGTSPNNPTMFVGRWSDPDTADGTSVFGSGSTVYPHGSPHIYWKVVKNSSSDWDFYYSTDGGCWFEIVPGADLGAFGTFDQVGFGLSSSDPAHVGMEWIRIRDIA